MTDQLLLRAPQVRNGMVGGASAIALILLAVFYSVVAGAVDRGQQRRSAVLVESLAAAEKMRPSPRPALALQAPPLRGPAFAPRPVSYVRSVN